MDAILSEFGIPVYMKIDIEGKEFDCLEALKNMPTPKFISVEDKRLDPATGIPPVLEMLNSLGYKYFNLVSQSDFRPLFRGGRAILS